MAEATRIVAALEESHVSLVATLPDQWIGEVIDAVERSRRLRHVRVTREEEGMGICAGAALGGARAALLCQNAGLLLGANALAAYTHHHRLPFVVLAAHRGTDGDPFAYQAYKGVVTEPVLRGLGVPFRVVDAVDGDLVDGALTEAESLGSPVVLLLSAAAVGFEQGGTS